MDPSSLEISKLLAWDYQPRFVQRVDFLDQHP